MKIVVNTSPIILLFKSNLDYILEQLATEIYLPGAVYDEIADYPQDGLFKILITKTAFRKLTIPVNQKILAWDLGKGETEVISCALNNQSLIPILDDAEAKACCLAHGLKPMGTGSLLVLAKKTGLISSVRESLQVMRDKGMWISDIVIDLLAQAAGE